MGVIDVLFHRQCSQKKLLRKSNHTPRVHQLFSVSPVSTSFRPLLLTSFYRVRDSAPDGSSPRGYSRNFRV
jgi:hypothetical protein